MLTLIKFCATIVVTPKSVAYELDNYTIPTNEAEQTLTALVRYS
jgi:hypothetical protein